MSDMNISVGQITDSGDLTVDTNTLKVNSTTDRVGIGTITPAEKLDIVGNLRVSGALMPNGTAGTVGQYLISGGTGAPPTWATLTSPVTGTGSSGAVAFWNSASSITQDSSNLFWDDTNNFLGVGIAVPTSKLHVASTTTSTTGVTQLNSAFTVSVGSTPSSGYYAASNSNLTLTGSTSYVGTAMYSQLGIFTNTNTSTLTSAAPFDAILSNDSTGTISAGYGYVASVSNTGGGAITSYYGLRLLNASSSSTNTYGVYLENSSGTNKWNIYSSGTAQNYLEGSLGIGALPTATSKVLVQKTETAISGTNVLTNNTYTVTPSGTTSSGALYYSLRGQLNVTASGTDNTNSTVIGVQSGVDNALTATTLGALVGVRVSNTNSSTGTIAISYGMLASNQNVTTGVLTTSYGMHAGLTNSSTGTVTTAYGHYNQITNSSTGTITTSYGFFNNVLNASGTMTTHTGYYHANLSAASTTAYGFRGLNSSGTNKYNLYMDGTAQNYLEGSLGIGIAVPTSKLHVVGTATISGVATFDSPIIYKGATGITAFATGGQASATSLTAEVNFVTTVATTADSVKIATPALGARQVVFNDGANSVDIFPPSGVQIDALGANNPYALAAGASREFWGKTATQWNSR